MAANSTRISSEPRSPESSWTRSRVPRDRVDPARSTARPDSWSASTASAWASVGAAASVADEISSRAAAQEAIPGDVAFEFAVEPIEVGGGSGPGERGGRGVVGDHRGAHGGKSAGAAAGGLVGGQQDPRVQLRRQLPDTGREAGGHHVVGQDAGVNVLAGGVQRGGEIGADEYGVALGVGLDLAAEALVGLHEPERVPDLVQQHGVEVVLPFAGQRVELRVPSEAVGVVVDGDAAEDGHAVGVDFEDLALAELAGAEVLDDELDVDGLVQSEHVLPGGDGRVEQIADRGFALDVQSGADPALEEALGENDVRRAAPGKPVVARQEREVAQVDRPGVVEIQGPDERGVGREHVVAVGGGEVGEVAQVDPAAVVDVVGDGPDFGLGARPTAASSAPTPVPSIRTLLSSRPRSWGARTWFSASMATPSSPSDSNLTRPSSV